MSGTGRVFFLALSTLIVSSACSSENTPATSDGTDPVDTGAVTSTGGSAAPSGEGGTVAPAGSGSGGSAGTGTGGSAGGTSAVENFDPPCDLTLNSAGAEIAKGVACAPEDPQLCWRKCGPAGVGWKSETCTNALYVEGDCVFPTNGDYSCFAIPETLHAECPTDPTLMPQASQECTVPECNPCNIDGQYKTSSGEAKVGYCVCQAPNSAGTRTWSCASGTAWPCPFGAGC